MFGAPAGVGGTGGLKEQCPGVLYDFEVEALCSDPAGGLNDLDSKVFTDLQVSWTPPILDDKAQVSVGINNILDEDPPPCLSCDLNNYDGTVYPIPGRFVHARVAVKF